MNTKSSCLYRKATKLRLMERANKLAHRLTLLDEQKPSADHPDRPIWEVGRQHVCDTLVDVGRQLRRLL